MRLVVFTTTHGAEIAVNPEQVCDLWNHSTDRGKTHLRTTVDSATHGDTNFWLIDKPLSEVVACLNEASR